jgi:hypothetical protein
MCVTIVTIFYLVNIIFLVLALALSLDYHLDYMECPVFLGYKAEDN